MTIQGQESSEAELERYAEDTSAQLQRLYILSTNHLEQQLQGYDLTIAQYMALATIVAFDREVSMSAVSRAIKTSPSSLTSITTRLESMGLIVRGRVSKDRRAVVVRATETGVTLIDALRQQQRRELIRMLGSMPPDVVAGLPMHLTRFADAMQEATSPAP